MTQTNKEYQLVLQFPLKDAAADLFDHFLELESELGLALQGDHQLIGHDLGQEVINIFLASNDPEKAIELIQETIPKEDLMEIVIALKSGRRDDYQVVWPESDQRDFKVNKFVN